MNVIFLLVTIIPSMLVGFTAGIGFMQMRVRALTVEADRIERARQQGQLDALNAKIRPSINPPSDYFRDTR